MSIIAKGLRDAAKRLLQHMPSHGPDCETEDGCEVFTEGNDGSYAGGPKWHMREAIRLFDEAARLDRASTGPEPTSSGELWSSDPKYEPL